MKRLLWILILCCVFLTAGTIGGWADAVRVISYGADITEAQREKVYQIFGLKESEKPNISVTEVTIREEKEYLQGIAGPAQIGSKAISCAYVEMLGPGEGIKVQTHNITWVTPEMYANALVTAGVTDARAIAAAPFPVTGTAALTGMIKAFETASGKELSKKAKDIAHEEIVRTGEIAETIDNEDKAADLIVRVKEEVIRRNLSDPKQIREVVINISNQLNIKLPEEQIDQLVSLMKKINGLQLNASQITDQLKDIKSKLDDLAARGDEVKGIIQRLIDFFAKVIASIQSLFGKLDLRFTC